MWVTCLFAMLILAEDAPLPDAGAGGQPAAALSA